jgi:iron uptake system component EfeO
VGDLARARTDWLTAHLDYEELGAAYRAFGDADRAINGLPSGLPGGTADPAFTGFHRLEFGLWHGQSSTVLRPVADRLLADVNGVAIAFRSAQIEPRDVAVRAQEITENALQFEVTGQTDFGSGSNLATVRAELDGTHELITVLSTLLRTRYPDLDALQRQWEKAVRDVESEHHGSAWTPVERLGRADRERIDADVSELTEMLAAVASICTPRRTS